MTEYWGGTIHFFLLTLIILKILGGGGEGAGARSPSPPTPRSLSPRAWVRPCVSVEAETSFICNRAGLYAFRENIGRAMVCIWRDRVGRAKHPDVFPNRAETCTITCLSPPSKTCIFEKIPGELSEPNTLLTSTSRHHDYKEVHKETVEILQI